MIFERTRVMNFEGALIGMRNPKNSWDRSDSFFGMISDDDEHDYEIVDAWVRKDLNLGEDYDGDPLYDYQEAWEKRDAWIIKNGILNCNNRDWWNAAEAAFIGPNDMKLAQTLIKAGPEHRKFLRQIFVSVDITAPVYWWKELDTYKVATVANSTSSMHTLVNSPINQASNWELDDYNIDIIKEFGDKLTPFIEMLEQLRLKYIETKDIKYWKELIRWLPSAWMQKRTWTCNYETLLGICSVSQRRFHKLTEWSNSFIKWARTLPYAQEFIFIDEQQ